MRVLYEGYTQALSKYLEMPLPPWITDQPHKDNWQTVAKLRAQTEVANTPTTDQAAHQDEPSRPISTLIDRHHDF
jgi:hypothetical protein